MRVTNQMNNYNGTRYLTTNYGRVAELNNKVSAERQIMAMVDNPTGAITGMKAFDAEVRTYQYKKNINTGTQALNGTSSKMNTIKGLLDDALKLVVGGADNTTTDDQRLANATELDAILKQIRLLSNSKDGDRYIFGGTNSGSAPFDSIGKYIIYKGNKNNISIPTGDKLNTQINCNGVDAFGNTQTTIPSRDLNPGVNLGTDTSTKLSALNNGQGVPKGKVMIYYSAYPEGLEVDLSNCETLEDVKDVIEKTTLDASKKLNPKEHSWLDNSNLDWRDLQDRYVKVTTNPDGNGISIQEFDLGEPLPPPTRKDVDQGLDYSGTVATDPITGHTVSYDTGGGGDGIGSGVVYDKNDYIYGDGTDKYSSMRVDNHANNKVASSLGVKGTANAFNPAAGRADPKLDGFIHGTDLNPTISASTLLADLQGYNDALWTLINGGKPGDVMINETTNDANNVFNDWALNNVVKKENSGPNGELYTRVTRRGVPENDLYVEVFSKPLAQAKATDLVATGSHATTGGPTGGTIVLQEANHSGLSGTVGIHLPTTVDDATVNLKVDWPETRQTTINVPAFREQMSADGTPRDYMNMFSGWNVTGLDKPPANGYDLNHPASTDLGGNVSVSTRMRNNGDGTSSLVVELCRPAYGAQPAVMIASGELNLGGNPPLDAPASGRISFTGAEGFESVGGSVYIELPAGVPDSTANIGTSATDPTETAFPLTTAVPAGTEIVLGGGMQLTGDQTLAGNMTLRQDSTFKAGQTFPAALHFPDGSILPAGMALAKDTAIPKGVVIPNGTTMLEGTVLQGGQEVTFSDPLAVGTVIPAGSYTTGGAGFTANGMMAPDGNVLGFNLEATFATVEDLMRAVEEADIYVGAKINKQGNGIEFTSLLGGAHLTVIEDTDCYEQMNDRYEQLSALDLNGLVKGKNTDPNGDLHTEIIYYPPDSQRTDGKVMLINDDGDQILIDAGYYVRMYSDKDALGKTYENRDNSAMVAEGFIPAGDWENPPTDPDNPFIPNAASGTLGIRAPLILEERNDSGVNGVVNFDYYGGKDQVTVASNAPFNNDDLTITPGGLRTTSSVHTTLQEVDISGFTPGVHSDFTGESHATISYEAGPPERTLVNVYRDSSHTHMVAEGEINSRTGEVVLWETDRNGNRTQDINGNDIRIGSMVVADNALLDGQSDNFSITMGGVSNGGQERETNMFSTLADALDALYANDVDTLHDLIDVITNDIKRITQAAGAVDSRSKQLQVLDARYDKDLIAYAEIWSSTIGMDEDAFIKYTQDFLSAQNAFNAAMTVSAKYMQMSVLDYL